MRGAGRVKLLCVSLSFCVRRTLPPRFITARYRVALSPHTTASLYHRTLPRRFITARNHRTIVLRPLRCRSRLMRSRYIALLCSIALTGATVACAPVATPRKSSGPQLQTVSQQAIDEFVVTVRDMAAWALVTPAGHIPVAGVQDSSGYVDAVVVPPSAITVSPDTVLALFRRTLAVSARKMTVRAVGLAYLTTQPASGTTRVVNGITVEVEFRSGYRTNVFFPYTRDEEQRPVFSASVVARGTLRAMQAAP